MLGGLLALADGQTGRRAEADTERCSGVAEGGGE